MTSGNVRLPSTSVVRFADSMFFLAADPSTKVLGYCHVVRFADEQCFYFLGKALPDSGSV